MTKELWHYDVYKLGEGNDVDGWHRIKLGTIAIERAYKLSDEEKLALIQDTYPEAVEYGFVRIDWAK